MDSQQKPPLVIGSMFSPVNPEDSPLAHKSHLDYEAQLRAKRRRTKEAPVGIKRQTRRRGDG